MQLGTKAWAQSFCANVNDSDAYRQAGSGWRWPLGLCFEAEGDAPARYVRLDLHDGRCRGVEVCDRATYEASPFRISAPYSRWDQVLRGGIEPMKALVLHRLRLEGELLMAIRYMPAAKALIECAAALESEAPNRGSGM